MSIDDAHLHSLTARKRFPLSSATASVPAPVASLIVGYS